MDVLKKIKSATLVEALIATVLIVVVFIVASLVINNLLVNTFSNNTTEIESRLYELEYELQNKKIEIPYDEAYKNWQISIAKITEPTSKHLVIELKASKKGIVKTVIRKRINE